VFRPAGPLPPRVYWVRRLIAIAIVLAVLLILSWAWGAIRGGGGPSTTGTSGSHTSSLHSSVTTSQHTPSPSTSTTPTHSASHSKSPSKSPSHSKSPTSSPSTSSSAPGPCPVKVVVVTVSTDAKSYPSDVQPRLAMSVRNSGSVACTRDVGQAALELRVATSAGVQIWSSDDCAPGGAHDVLTLQPNQVFRTAVVWGRATSKQGCPSGEPKAPSGSYVLTGRDLAVTSAGATFTLL
jgi:hypothetical protein